jgi:ABC-type multidrug transport system fused ATPase/permease subunit
MVLGLLGALTEAVGIGLFVPLLDTVSNKPNFANIPLLAQLSEAFAHIAPEWRIKIVALIMLVVVIARSVLQFLVQYLNAYLQARVEQQLRNDSFDRLLGMDLAFINRNKSGSIQNLVAHHPTRIGQAIGNLGILISNLVLLLIHATVMLLISVTLTMMALVLVAGVFYLQRHISSGPLRRAGADVSSASRNITQLLYETLAGLSLIRLSVAGARISARHCEATAALRAAQTRYAIASALAVPLFIATSGILVCVMLFAASAGGRESAGAVATTLLFLILMQRLIAPAGAITFARNAILLHMDAIVEYGKWINRARQMVQKDGHIPFAGLQAGIRFKAVSFSYEPESDEVLRDVSLFIPKGQMTAIVGPSGAGKSTIVALLGRLYDPQSGCIEVDGVDLRDYKVDTWRRALSVVSQSIFLVNDTVERNLTYSLDRPASEAEMRRAAETAACAGFIEDLPDGYQTLIGERGTRLSGGQQQRLAIARAILVNPQLMIMDEATSSLDSISEHAVQSAMATFGRSRTMVVIAHRLATIKRADNIIVMDEGRVIEQGRHDVLLAQRGRYWEMIEHQRLDIVDVPEEQPALA